MGGNISKSEQITNIVNSTTTSVMSNISTSVKSASQQSNVLKISGLKNSNVSNIEQSNESKIDISAVIQSASSGQLQSQLTAALTQAVKQNSSAIGYSAQDNSISTNIANIVNTNITTNSVNDAFAGVTQSNAIEIERSSNINVSGVKQSNVGSAVSKLMSSTSTDIQAMLGIDAKADISSSQTASNPISDFTSSLGSFLSGPLGIILMIVIAVAVGGFMLKMGISRGIIKMGGDVSSDLDNQNGLDVDESVANHWMLG